MDAQVSKISYSDGSIILLIISHKKRIHAVNPLYCMNNKVGVPCTTYGHNAVIVVARTAPEFLQDSPQRLAPFSPVKNVFFLVNPTTAAETIFVDG